MVAGTVSDLDGIGIVFGVEYYQRYHHVVGHNLLMSVVGAAVLTIFSQSRCLAFCMYFALFHAHIALDLLGSGSGWGMHYLWPFGDLYLENPYVWELQSWQTTVVLMICLVWTMIIAYRERRTPLELLAPRLDAKAVKWLQEFVAR